MKGIIILSIVGSIISVDLFGIQNLVNSNHPPMKVEEKKVEPKAAEVKPVQNLNTNSLPQNRELPDEAFDIDSLLDGKPVAPPTQPPKKAPEPIIVPNLEFKPPTKKDDKKDDKKDRKPKHDNKYDDKYDNDRYGRPSHDYYGDYDNDNYDRYGRPSYNDYEDY